jgi:hypothetical protein
LKQRGGISGISISPLKEAAVKLKGLWVNVGKEWMFFPGAKVLYSDMNHNRVLLESNTRRQHVASGSTTWETSAKGWLSKPYGD